MHVQRWPKCLIFTIYSCISIQPIQTGILHFWTDLSDIHIRKDPLSTSSPLPRNSLHVYKTTHSSRKIISLNSRFGNCYLSVHCINDSNSDEAYTSPSTSTVAIFRIFRTLALLDVNICATIFILDSIVVKRLIA